MTPCLTCQNLQLKPYPEHVKIGWGRCSKKDAATFVYIGRNVPCVDYKEEDTEKVKSRREWWIKKEK